MSEFADRLRAEFSDSEYRHAYSETTLNATLAAQIEFLREQRGWSQEELGRRAAMSQSAISRIEDVDYAKWSVGTLRKLARAFDLTLSIRFESFGEFFRALSRTRRTDLEKPSFDVDPALLGTAVATATSLDSTEEVLKKWVAIALETHRGVESYGQVEWLRLAQRSPSIPQTLGTTGLSRHARKSSGESATTGYEYHVHSFATTAAAGVVQ